MDLGTIELHFDLKSEASGLGFLFYRQVTGTILDGLGNFLRDMKQLTPIAPEPGQPRTMEFRAEDPAGFVSGQIIAIYRPPHTYTEGQIDQLEMVLKEYVQDAQERNARSYAAVTSKVEDFIGSS